MLVCSQTMAFVWFQLGRRSHTCEVLLISEKPSELHSPLRKCVYAGLSSHCQAQSGELLFQAQKLNLHQTMGKDLSSRAQQYDEVRYTDLDPGRSCMICISFENYD